eukprot:149457_1
MALSTRHHEQQLTANINEDIAALENNNTHYDDEITPMNLENITGYKLSDLLNGLVQDPNTLKSFDECLNVIVSEYNDSNILKVSMNEIETLLNKKNNSSYKQILNTVIDSNYHIFDTLLRVARKIKAIGLVTKQQRMIHIPHKLEDVQSVIEQLRDIGIGVLNNSKVKKPKKKQQQSPKEKADSAIIVYDEHKEEKKEIYDEKDDNDIISEIEPEEKPDLSSVNGLKDLIFTDRKLYKKTVLYQKRDKKKKKINFENIGKFGRTNSKKTDI